MKLEKLFETIISKIKSCPPCAIASFTVLGLFSLAKIGKRWYNDYLLLEALKTEKQENPGMIQISNTQKFLVHQEASLKGQGNIVVGIKTFGSTDQIEIMLETLRKQFLILNSYLIQSGINQEIQLFVDKNSKGKLPFKNITINSSQLENVFRKKLNSNLSKPFGSSSFLWKVILINSNEMKESFFIFKFHPVLMDKMSLSVLLSFFFSCNQIISQPSIKDKFPQQNEESLEFSIPNPGFFTKFLKICFDFLSLNKIGHSIEPIRYSLDRKRNPTIQRSTKFTTISFTNLETKKIMDEIEKNSSNLISTIAASITSVLISDLIKQKKNIPKKIEWSTDMINGRNLNENQNIVAPFSTGLRNDIYSNISFLSSENSNNSKTETFWELSKTLKKNLEDTQESWPFEILKWFNEYLGFDELKMRWKKKTKPYYGLRDGKNSFFISNFGKIDTQNSQNPQIKEIQIGNAHHISGPSFHFNFLIVDNSLFITLASIYPLLEDDHAKNLLDSVKNQILKFIN